MAASASIEKTWRERVVLINFFALAAVVGAQNLEEEDEEDEEDSWSLVLALVVVIVALSLLSICLIVVICEIRTSKPPRSKPHKVELVDCGMQADRPTTPIQVIIGVRPPSLTASVTSLNDAAEEEVNDFGRNLDDAYRLSGDWTQGRSSRVFRATSIENARTVAIKAFQDRDACLREFEIYSEMYHGVERSASKREARSYTPDLVDYGIITVDSVQQNALVLQPALFHLENYLVRKKESSQYVVLSERSTYEQICVAIRYIHRKGYVHGNINPRNIMFFGNRWKLIGFGNWGNNDRDMRCCMTPNYTSPEIMQAVSNGHSSIPFCQPSDIWSLGLIGWEVLTKTPLLPTETYSVESVKRMSFGDIPYPWEGKPAQFWSKIKSPSAIKLIQNCLHRDPEKRWDIEKVLRNIKF